jgi:hypothetical protein
MTRFAGRLSEREIVYGVVAGLIVAGLIYAGKKAADVVKETAAAAAKALDPTSDNNFAYRGANAVGGILTGDENYTVGSWWYDKWLDNPDSHIVDPTPQNLVIDGTLVSGRNRELIR